MNIYGISTAPDDAAERQIYADAWRIADPGACNPVAVAGTLAKASSALLHRIGTAGVRTHPALRVMAGQLAMLYGVSSLGANIDDYDTVENYVKGLTASQENQAQRDELMPLACGSCGAEADPATLQVDHFGWCAQTSRQESTS